MELCAITSSELTHSWGRERFAIPFLMKSSEKSEFPPVLEPEIGILNSTEFLLVKGNTFTPVLGNTHLTKNTRVRVLLIMELWK